MPRTAPRALAALALLFAVPALAGCAAGADPGPRDTSAAASCGAADGDTVDAVQLTGDFGSEPAVSFDTPLSATGTERRIATAGDGPELDPGSTAIVEIALFNGATGEQATTTGFDQGGEQTVGVAENAILAGLYQTLACAHVGDRIVSTVGPEQAFGDAGLPDLGIDPGTSIVFVVDVLAIVPDRADGEDQPAPDGFPTVTLDADGAPTITIPAGDPPAELKIAVLKKGDGEIVQDGDEVTVQYQGVNWRTGEVFDQSWGRGAASFTTSGVIPGFGAALVGQTVGSQVIAVIPPDQGYGPSGGNASAGIEADDTLVFVVDILATRHAQ